MVVEVVIDSAESAINAFDAEYPLLFDDLARLCRALGAGAGAEDFAQEALLYGRSHLSELRDPKKLQPWLRRIAVRFVSKGRDERRRPLEAAALVFVPVDGDLGLDAAAAVMQLPSRERLAVSLVYGLGYQQDEAADVLGIARGTIAASLWKARRRLAVALADYAGRIGR